MISLPSLSVALLDGAFVVLFLGLAAIMYKWGRPDRFRSTSRLRAFVTDFAPLLASSGLVILCGALVVAAYVVRIKDPAAIDRSLLPGFAASLLEDLFFFIAVGVITFVVQRREFERGRSASDRIDTLFNAKRLSAIEMQDLRNRIRESSCDFRRCEATIDIREYQTDASGADCVMFDIRRKWLLASYLTDEYALHDWKLAIKPDDIAGISPLLQVYPSITRAYRVEHGQQITSSPAKTLNTLIIQHTPEPFVYPQRPPGAKTDFETIKPGEIRVFAARYLIWNRLKPVTGGSETFAFSMNRHWDAFVLQISNSLPQRVAVRVVSGIVDEHVLEAGESTEALIYRDISWDAKIKIEIEMLTGGARSSFLS